MPSPVPITATCYSTSRRSPTSPGSRAAGWSWVYVSLVAVIIVVVHLLESDIQNIRAADYDAFTRIVTTGFVYWTVHKLRRTIVALRAANAGLERLNDQKNLLFGVISHDLKSPFNAILGYAELLEALVGPAADDPREGIRRQPRRGRAAGLRPARQPAAMGPAARWSARPCSPAMSRFSCWSSAASRRSAPQRRSKASRSSSSRRRRDYRSTPISRRRRRCCGTSSAMRSNSRCSGGRVTIAARAVGGLTEICGRRHRRGHSPKAAWRALFEIVPNRSTTGTAGESRHRPRPHPLPGPDRAQRQPHRRRKPGRPRLALHGRAAPRPTGRPIDCIRVPPAERAAENSCRAPPGDIRVGASRGRSPRAAGDRAGVSASRAPDMYTP